MGVAWKTAPSTYDRPFFRWELWCRVLDCLGDRDPGTLLTPLPNRSRHSTQWSLEQPANPKQYYFLVNGFQVFYGCSLYSVYQSKCIKNQNLNVVSLDSILEQQKFKIGNSVYIFFFFRHKKPVSYSLAGETTKWSWVLVLLFTSWGAKDIHLSRKCVVCGSSLEPLTLNTPPGTKDATPMRVRLPDGMLPLWEGISIHLPTENRLLLLLKKGHREVALIFMTRDATWMLHTKETLRDNFIGDFNKPKQLLFYSNENVYPLPQALLRIGLKSRMSDWSREMASAFLGLYFLFYFLPWSVLWVLPKNPYFLIYKENHLVINSK